eukprot:5905870-Alexandrium_andersonii.AAC.1
MSYRPSRVITQSALPSRVHHGSITGVPRPLCDVLSAITGNRAVGTTVAGPSRVHHGLSLIHISEPTRLALI